MAETLTPPPIQQAIAEQPGLLTPRVWTRYFQSVRAQVLALTAWRDGLLAITPPPAIAPASATGTADAAARGDHTHGPLLATSAPPAIAAASALGTAPEAAHGDHTHAALFPLALSAPPAIAAAGAVGTADAAGRGDHTHAALFLLATTAPPAIAGTGAVGTASTAARGDHTHAALATTFQAQLDALGARIAALEQPVLSKPL